MTTTETNPAGWRQTGLLFLLYLLLHAAGVQLGIFFSVNSEGIATFWPSAGLLIAILLLRQNRDWPWLLLASVVAQLLADIVFAGRRELGPSLYFGLTNALEALFAAFLLRRF